jgi:pimeloyl-ACP methyl ester carboxylesterase
MKKIILIVVFTSLTAWIYAQCDSLRDVTYSVERAFERLTIPYFECFPQPAPPLETRRIYFIHGLGGSATAWEKAAEACENTDWNSSSFKARKCETIRADYTNSVQSLYSAASDVRNEIANQADLDRGRNLLPEQSILIAHSQGGMIVRELMHLDMVTQTTHSSLHAGMNYGGVVTIASPLQGAKILNNRNMLLNMIGDGCNRLAKGPLADASTTITNSLPNIIVNLWGNNINNFLRKLFGNLTETVCGSAPNILKTLFFTDYYKGITDSYTVGAPMINTLNNDANNDDYKPFPKVAFYAVEPQENIMWRTLNWIVNDPNTKDPFKADDDWQLFDNTVKPMIDLYQAKKETYYSYYTLSEWAFSMIDDAKNKQCKVWKLILCPPCMITCAVLDAERTKTIRERNLRYDAYTKWSDGLDWFNNANASWQTVIGARTNNSINIYNDGVVLAESAANLPSATNEPVEIYPNKNTNATNRGSTHMQVRNDSGLKEHLNKLFNGNYGHFFWTYEQ